MWATIQTRDNWGAISTFAVADGIEYPIESSEYWLQFPDMTQESFPIEYRREHNTVSDHGHPYDSVSVIPYVTLNYHGSRVPVELYKLGCKIWI